MDQNEIAIRETANTSLANAGIQSAMIQTREMTEIQAMVISAKRFPRDIAQVRADILASCDSPALAEVSQYLYSKGGTEISGTSIRLAEEMACAFTNMDKGWIELERKSSQGNIPGESVIQCFAWDMQRNVKAKRTFTVRHWRDTKQGGYALKDERDIYELCANQAARRLRACILEIIPKFVQEEALVRCDETLAKNAKGGKLDKRINDMVGAFAKLGVTKEMIEKRIQHKAEATSEIEIVNLHKVYTSLVDGMSTAAQWFEVGAPAAETQSAPSAAAPTTQSVAKKTKAAKTADSGPKNFATPEGIDELAKQREAKEQNARTAAANEPAFDPVESAPPAAAPPVEAAADGAPTWKEIWESCAAACRHLGWSPVRLADFTKEKFGKSPAQMQRENNVKELVQVYETLMQCERD